LGVADHAIQNTHTTVHEAAITVAIPVASANPSGWPEIGPNDSGGMPLAISNDPP